MSARQVGKTPVREETASAAPVRATATTGERGNAAVQEQVKAAQAQKGGVRGWLEGVGQAAVDTTSRAMESVGEAWSAVKEAGQELSTAVGASGITSEDGVISAHTDLDAVSPLLPAAWSAALGKGPADPAANRVGVSLDTAKDRLTLTIPDLRLAGMMLGGYRVASLAVSGVVLTLDNAGGVGRTLAARQLGGGLLGGLVGQTASNRVGAVRLTVDRLVATGVNGPGGGVGRIEAEGLDATVGADGQGLVEAADSPLGVSGAFKLRSLTVGALDAGGTHADAISAAGVRLEGHADTGEASLAVGSAGVKNLAVGGTRVGSGSVQQLTASGDVNGASRSSKRWSDIVDPARAQGTAALSAAHLGGASLAGASVGALDVKGVEVGRGATGERASVQSALATDVSAGGAQVGRASVTDASITSAGGRNDVHAGLVDVNKASAAGTSVSSARAAGVDARWSGGSGSGSVHDMNAEKVAVRLPETRIDAASLSASGVSGSRGADGVGARADQLAAQGVRVDHAAQAAAPVTKAAPTSAGAAPGKGGAAGAHASDPSVRLDPVALAGLVKDADLHATAPLGARDYGGSVLGGTVLPGTQATANVSVHDGKLVPGGTNVKLNKGVDLPAWVEGDGAYMTRGDGDTGRVKADLGGAPDLDVTKYIPGVESGVPLGVSDLARRYATPAAAKGGATSGTATSGTATSGAATSGGAAASGPAPVDLAHLSGTGSASLAGGFDVGVASGVLAGERAGDNRVSGTVKDGGKNVAVEFIRLLVGSLRVRVGGGEASATKATVTSGRVSVDSGAAGSVHGEIGSVKLEGAEGHVR